MMWEEMRKYLENETRDSNVLPITVSERVRLRDSPELLYRKVCLIILSYHTSNIFIIGISL